MPFLFPWVYEQGLDRLRKIFQLEPIEFPTARQNPEFLSKNPKVRADDISKLRAKKLTITQILRTRLGKSGRDEKKKDLSVSL
jgi:hypothetical protein